MIWAFTNMKGGVGKSTLAVHFSAWLHDQGHKVALIDTDVQKSSSTWLQEASPETPIFRLPTPDDVLDQLPKLQTQFDHIVVDGPGGLSELTRTILCLADITLLPCGPSVVDLRAVTEAIRVVRQIQDIRKGIPSGWIVPNRLQIQYRLSQEFMETVGTLAIPATSPIRLRQAYADAAGQGTVVWRMGLRAKDAATEIQNVLREVYESATTIDERRTANG